MFYAELNEENIAFAITQTIAPKENAKSILLNSYDVNVLNKKWNGIAWIDSTSPIPEDLTEYTYQNKPLDELELIYLCQEYGGMTDEMLVDVYENPLLKAFVIKLKASRNILPTDPRTIAGLSALETLGYLPNGKDAIINNWPKI